MLFFSSFLFFARRAIRGGYRHAARSICIGGSCCNKVLEANKAPYTIYITKKKRSNTHYALLACVSDH